MIRLRSVTKISTTAVSIAVTHGPAGTNCCAPQNMNATASKISFVIARRGRPELRRQRADRHAARELAAPDLQPPAFVRGERGLVFRRGGMRDLRALRVTDPRVHVPRALGAERKDVGLGVDEPFAHDAPVRV